MNNPWFRLYSEIIDDPKLLMLSFEDRWHYVALLCLKNNGVLDAERDESRLMRKIALKLGLSINSLEEVKRRLMEEQLIDENYHPLAWNKRQYRSDSSAERVRKHREKKRLEKESKNEGVTACNGDVTKNVTHNENIQSSEPLDLQGLESMKQQCNVTVTPPEAEAEAEAEAETEQISTTTRPNELEKFEMHDRWKPSAEAEALARLQCFLEYEKLDTPENRGEFISYWKTQFRGGFLTRLTSDEWTHKYIKDLKRKVTYGNSHKRSTSSSNSKSASSRARLLHQKLQANESKMG